MKFSRKGMDSNTLWLIMAFAFVSLVAVFYYGGVIDKIRVAILGVGEFGSCENGVNDLAGMCISSDAVCRTSNKVGVMLSGCPSERIKSNLKIDVSKYTQCCVANRCSDVNDKVNNEYKPRKSACFDDAVCKKIPVTSPDKCIGFAGDCKKNDGCCCVQG
jgi:hypothetical protein